MCFHASLQVGNAVFIATGAIIMGNIPVGDGAIINAGSVVTKPVKPYTRVGGVPGREISKFAMNETVITDITKRYEEEMNAEFPTTYTSVKGV